MRPRPSYWIEIGENAAQLDDLTAKHYQHFGGSRLKEKKQ